VTGFGIASRLPRQCRAPDAGCAGQARRGQQCRRSVQESSRRPSYPASPPDQSQIHNLQQMSIGVQPDQSAEFNRRSSHFRCPGRRLWWTPSNPADWHHRIRHDGHMTGDIVACPEAKQWLSTIRLGASIMTRLRLQAVNDGRSRQC
jgi:hypothetical protein